MAEISAQLVKQLRERTGAGMMECKKALQEANGDLDGGEVVLRKRGIAGASKKESRSTKQGLVSVHTSGDGKVGVRCGCILNCFDEAVKSSESFYLFCVVKFCAIE